MTSHLLRNLSDVLATKLGVGVLPQDEGCELLGRLFGKAHVGVGAAESVHDEVVVEPARPSVQAVTVLEDGQLGKPVAYFRPPPSLTPTAEQVRLDDGHLVSDAAERRWQQQH